MPLMPTTGSSMNPMRAPDASPQTQATPVTSTKPAPKLAPLKPEKAALEDDLSQQLRYVRSLGQGRKTTSQIPVDMNPQAGAGPIGGPVVWDQPQIPPVAPRPATVDPTRPILDEETMLAAQILDDADYAAYLNERRTGGQQR